MSTSVFPFENVRYLGSVVVVNPAHALVNLPYASGCISSSYSGHRLGRGEVGEFVVIEGETHAVLGRIASIRLPEGDRLAVEPGRPGRRQETHINPVGKVQLLLSMELASGKPVRGVPMHPRIGQYVYSAHPDLVKQAIGGVGGDNGTRVELARIPDSPTARVSFSPTALFSRHCAILGATGGGKSWTVARILGEIARYGGKAILCDPSGEFVTLTDSVRHVYLGRAPSGDQDGREFVSFAYRYLSEADLFALFQPGGGSQAPKLREALTSLKLLHCDSNLGTDGLVKKANRSKNAFDNALRQYSAVIRRPGANYDITLLAEQIDEECVWPTGRGNGDNRWGNYDQNTRGYCTTLVSRISVQVHSDELAPIFQPGPLHDVTEVLSEFLADEKQRILRISMEHLPFEHNTRELIANGFGRYLLTKARAGAFRERPVVVIVDEAHQFLNKSVGDEANRIRLESFGLIAKEGRKYGLGTVIATQRPRDIPQDVLSQMGVFIVHRLVNDRDRQIVEHACGNIDASAAAFLPVLGQGEALVVGLDAPMPIPTKILRPKEEPESTDVFPW